ncbi:hypothetical protein [Allokutzneria multivorans]
MTELEEVRAGLRAVSQEIPLLRVASARARLDDVHEARDFGAVTPWSPPSATSAHACSQPWTTSRSTTSPRPSPLRTRAGVELTLRGNRDKDAEMESIGRALIPRLRHRGYLPARLIFGTLLLLDKAD